MNDATLLNNCSLRYKRKQIYTYVGNILISINPYEYISNLYDENVIENYMGKSLGSMPPHIFSIGFYFLINLYIKIKGIFISLY